MHVDPNVLNPFPNYSYKLSLTRSNNHQISNSFIKSCQVSSSIARHWPTSFSKVPANNHFGSLIASNLYSNSKVFPNSHWSSHFHSNDLPFDASTIDGRRLNEESSSASSYLNSIAHLPNAQVPAHSQNCHFVYPPATNFDNSVSKSSDSTGNSSSNNVMIYSWMNPKSASDSKL